MLDQATYTPRLKALLEDYGIVQALPGGRGYFGYNDTRRAYVEVLALTPDAQRAEFVERLAASVYKQG